MERLTEKVDNNYFPKQRRVDTGEYAGNKLCLDKLGKYEDLEEKQRLVLLPCELGSTLYDITEFVDGTDYPEIYVLDASKIEISKDEKGILYCIDCVEFRQEHFGTVLFESMEAAESKIIELNNQLMKVATTVCCPMCDKKKCDGRYTCSEIRNYIQQSKKRKNGVITE